MFSIGDNIVYPMYGVGEIIDIQIKSRDNKDIKYYTINIPTGTLRIIVSSEKAEQLGLRAVDNCEDVLEAIDKVSNMPLVVNENWSQRYKDNLEKMKSGKLVEMAEVVRILFIRDKNKGLSSVEKKMLNNAKQIVLSEVAYSINIDNESAKELLAKSLFNC